jgi:hypothetical protein
LIVYWILMRVLDELSHREEYVNADMQEAEQQNNAADAVMPSVNGIH